MNWREARDLLDGKGKRRGPRDSLKIQRNTYLERRSPGLDGYPDNAIGVRLHGTYVAIMTPQWTELNTGGYPTVTTRDRMQIVSGIHIDADRNGWQVFLTRDDLPCYCTRERHEGLFIVTIGEPGIGKELIFTDTYQGESEFNPNGKPVYRWETCDTCKGTGRRTGVDWESGGHPYFEGIRVSADGRRLMSLQPFRHRRNWTPTKTVSGYDL